MIVLFGIMLLYFIGSIIYCLLNKHRVGRNESDEWGYSRIEPQDIAFEACLWPGFLLMFVVLFPYRFLVKLIELCGQKKR